MNPQPVAIVTDVHYRMSLALIRELAEAQITVITCEKDTYRNNAASPALGGLSRYCSQHFWLPEEDYLQALAALSDKMGKEYHCKPVLLPVGAGTLASVAEHRHLIEPTAGLLIPTTEQLDLMNDKARISMLASELGIPVPVNHAVSDPADITHIPLPCVIKPRYGEKLGLSASDRYAIVATHEAAAEQYKCFSRLAQEPPLVQTYLPGNGIGCSILAVDGTVINAIAHRRIREYPITGGPSSCCQCIDTKDILPPVKKLVAHTGYTGLAMFEFKEDAQGIPHLLEVNPRIWGTFPLTRVSRSGISLLWFTLAWNRANPNLLLEEKVSSPTVGKKMIFSASDLMAGLGYARNGQIKKLFSALVDLLNPLVRDGIWEWKDLSPAAKYYGSLLKKEGRS